jgi:hypothetical protein
MTVIQFPAEAGLFPSQRLSQSCGLPSLSNQWVTGAFFPRSNLLESETDNSSSAEIKNVWSFTSIKPYVFATWHLSTVTTLTIVVPFEAV